MELIPGLAEGRVRSLTIGSAAECGLRIDGDPFVSGVHARVVQDADGEFWVEDLGSTNGTWLQRAGQPMPAHPCLLPRVRGFTRLRPGDRVWLSRSTVIPLESA